MKEDLQIINLKEFDLDVERLLKEVPKELEGIEEVTAAVLDETFGIVDVGTAKGSVVIEDAKKVPLVAIEDSEISLILVSVVQHFKAVMGKVVSVRFFPNGEVFQNLENGETQMTNVKDSPTFSSSSQTMYLFKTTED